MWEIEKTVGDKKVYKCTECGYEILARIPPEECPKCGNVTVQTHSIDLKRSSMDIDDDEVEVYEYERETPVYKLWYFWVILIVSVAVISSGLMFARTRMSSIGPSGTDSISEVSFTPPTGWEKLSNNSYAGPGDGSEIKIAVHKVSRFSDVDEFGQLVAELAGVEDVEKKEINGINGRYVVWKTRKEVDGKEVFTDFGRFVFVHKGKLYVIMYKSLDGNPETFDTFINTISK